MGYPKAELDAGKKLLSDYETALQAQPREQGQKQRATQAEQTADDQAQEAYQTLAEIARVTFREDDATLAALGLNEAMPRALAPFLIAARTLLTNAKSDPVAHAALARFGYDDARYASELAKIDALARADEVQAGARGVSERATQTQNEAWKSLNDWQRAYKVVARRALKNQPALAMDFTALLTW